MATFTTYMRRLAATAAVLAFAISEAAATPVVLPGAADAAPVQLAAADCFAIGEQVAAQYGGTLAKASASNRGGQTVCHIVVLVPGKDGQRPRRVQVDVPAG
jgi:hypothetical protein